MDKSPLMLTCSWCQFVKEVSPILSYTTVNSEHFICPDCLIPMMSFSLDEQNKSTKAKKNQKQSIENRENPRFDLFTQIQLALHSSGIKQISALVLNTSSSGLKIETTVEIAQHELISLRLVGEVREFAAIGKVVYVTELTSQGIAYFQAGIHLTKILDT